jgi:putative addiction module killer protein
LEIRKTRIFEDWISGLRDLNAVARIDVRIRRLSLGNAGDARPVGEGVSELRIDYGPGYRVYFSRRGREIILLLCGGDKGSQDRDIAKAKELAKEDKNGS